MMSQAENTTMLTAMRNRVVYTPDSSRAIGDADCQQRLAYNEGVEYTLAHPGVSKYELQRQLTAWRHQDPEKWSGQVAVQRPGLFRGRHAVRQYDTASGKTLRECLKEVKLRNAKKQSRKLPKAPKHPVRPGRDLNPQRLYRRRKHKAAVAIEDANSIRVHSPKQITAASISIELAEPLPADADVRAVHITERKSSLRKGRNRPLENRSYEIVLILHVPDPEEKDPWQNPVGCDAGIVNPLATSNSRVYRLPDTLDEIDKAVKELRERQKRLKYKGQQWRKIQKQVRRLLRKVSNIKDDWEHHVGKELAERHGFVSVEDLHLADMRGSAKGTPENPGKNVRAKSGLNRSLARVRPAKLLSKIGRQCEKAGAWFTKVPAPGTSQTCPHCGHRAKGNRKRQAEFLCRSCGYPAHADQNAAQNALGQGLRALVLLTVLCIYREAAGQARRRPGMPPLTDSLSLATGRPGIALGRAITRHRGGVRPGTGPTPVQTKMCF